MTQKLVSVGTCPDLSDFSENQTPNTKSRKIIFAKKKKKKTEREHLHIKCTDFCIKIKIQQFSAKHEKISRKISPESILKLIKVNDESKTRISQNRPRSARFERKNQSPNTNVKKIK